MKHADNLFAGRAVKVWVYVKVNCRRFGCDDLYKIANCCCSFWKYPPGGSRAMTFSVINFETLKACHWAFLQPKRHFSTAGDDVHTCIQIAVRSLTEICTAPHYRVESDEKAIVELSQKCFFVARSYRMCMEPLDYCIVHWIQLNTENIPGTSPESFSFALFWYAFH